MACSAWRWSGVAMETASILLSSRILRMSVKPAGRLPPHSAPRRYPRNQLSLPNHKNATHQHVRKSVRISRRVVEGSVIDHSLWIDHSDIRIGPHLHPSFGLDP